jgi:hypothetical protein
VEACGNAGLWKTLGVFTTTLGQLLAWYGVAHITTSAADRVRVANTYIQMKKRNKKDPLSWSGSKSQIIVHN